MIHEIERLRGPPGQIGWFDEQPRDVQIELMAWYRVHCDPAGEARKPKLVKRERRLRPGRAEARRGAG